MCHCHVPAIIIYFSVETNLTNPFENKYMTKIKTAYENCIAKQFLYPKIAHDICRITSKCRKNAPERFTINIPDKFENKGFNTSVETKLS